MMINNVTSHPEYATITLVDARKNSMQSSSITLCEDDTPGAALPEPLESHNVASTQMVASLP